MYQSMLIILRMVHLEMGKMPTPEEKPKSINWWWVIALIVVLVILVVVIWWWQHDTDSPTISPGGSTMDLTGYAKTSTTVGRTDTMTRKTLPVSQVPNAKADTTSATDVKFKPAIRGKKNHCSVDAFDAAARYTSPSPYTPQQVQAAYTSSIAPNGAGKKIAIIIAFNYSGLQTDLNAFCRTFGLPQKNLIIHNMAANTASDQGWQLEANLDTQYATLMAPNASIYVVFAKSDSYTDLIAALAYANQTIRPDIVSMSWGMDETGLTHSMLASTFEPQFSGTGATASFYLAASGDALSVSYPSTSNSVIAVGGTTLVMNGTKRAGEYSWDDPNTVGSGEGLSSIFTRPSYQTNTNSSLYRMTPDVSLISSNPSEQGVMVVHGGSIYGVSGTSLATPLFAGILASGLSARTSTAPLTQTRLLTSIYNLIPTSTSIPFSPLQGIGAINQNIIPFIRNL
jgi:subtilase family serine protease